jgi:hypothetical protein
MSSGTDQVGAVEVVDVWRGTGPTRDGLQWRDDGTIGTSRV